MQADIEAKKAEGLCDLCLKFKKNIVDHVTIDHGTKVKWTKYRYKCLTCYADFPTTETLDKHKKDNIYQTWVSNLEFLINIHPK